VQNGPQDGAADITTVNDIRSGSLVPRILDALATLQMPHEYFRHFYIVSVLSSVFWAMQILMKGTAFQAICGYATLHNSSKSMTINQVALTWGLMMIQGVRRLYESWTLGKSPGSKMWFTHWVLGIAFYISFGIALWIEGTPAFLSTDSVYSSITRSVPAMKTMIGIPIFILASGLQHDCHTYLASLPKYTLPVHPIFQVLVCPHYFAECLIYLSLAIIGAPKGVALNKTIACALLFVGTNLAVTASMSKEWYEQKFGKEAVAGKWKMVPWLY
jgi:3-oxo-5-alpha-steroid 4-dehydrogenase 3